MILGRIPTNRRTPPRGALLLLLGLLAATGLARPALAHAAGPWTAQILDAETGQPLEGVVVLAAWYRRYNSPAGEAGGGYYASDEVVTGPDGRFVIPARFTFTFLPFLTRINGPDFSIFKPGYGQWRFQGSETWPWDAVERRRHVDQAWRRFAGDGAIIVLPPLKTREERLKFFDRISAPVEVPDSEMRALLNALDRESVFLGFKPTGRGTTGRPE